jgi:hypothetical protein
MIIEKEIEKLEIKNISYARVVHNLVYVMVCMWLDITYVLGQVIQFIIN